DVETILLDEFYPYVESTQSLNIDSGKEITDFGLPFEKESAVTRHIIRFLENHREDVKKNLSKDPLPDFILFNGGTLKPVLVQERIRQAIGKWFNAGESELPQILENQIPELAVGIGASYYGLVKQGKGVKVGSGSPRSYYIGVSDKEKNSSKAVCIVERGLDEGSVIDLTQMKYEVRANEPVSFDIYYSSYRSGDKAGDIIAVDDSFSSMTPIQTIIKFGKNGQRKIIPVTIGAEYTEMGTLSMYCHSGVSDHKWKLQFQLRDPGKGVNSSETEVYDEDLIKDTCNRVHQVFTDKSDKDGALKSIVRQIEKIVAQKKSNWPLSFLRSIADKLIELENTRKYSAGHEARWLNLTGFCMRPGFGDAFDEERARRLWKIYLSGMKFEKIIQNRLEWWIFIRRIAAGLKAGQQRQFFQATASVLIKGKNGKTKLSPREQIELWMAAGNMERLLVKDKVVLAKFLLPILKPGKKQDNMFWVLSRLGARELLYGSVDRVVPAKEIIKWINQVMKKSWHKKDPIENMISQISRKTGDRTRDIDQENVLRIIDWMHERKAKESFIRIIKEKMDMAVKEKSAQFGEKLPAGLVLR
ncbi:MAG: molecular chaperone DnaK, partial [Desulfosporosinus sp.]|nr:molecular chaperone DnaK [Desulfosporosinus sp.]